jgi:SsrA-binding protein
MAKGPPPPPRIVNKKARYNFELLETLETGIVLTGSEVKSLRAGRASLDEAYAFIRDGELYLLDCHISPYANAGYAQHDPVRPRKLLVHRRELKRLHTKVTQKGLTLVPVGMHFSERGMVKVDVALARGKTHADKRDTIRQRDQQRELDREFRRRR